MGVLRWSKAVYDSQLNHMKSINRRKDQGRGMAISDDDDDDRSFGFRTSFWQDNDIFSSRLRNKGEQKDGSDPAQFGPRPPTPKYAGGPDTGGPPRQDGSQGQNRNSGNAGQVSGQFGQGQGFSNGGQNPRPGQNPAQNFGGGRPQVDVEGNSGEQRGGQQDQSQQNNGGQNNGGQNNGQQNNGQQNNGQQNNGQQTDGQPNRGQQQGNQGSDEERPKDSPKPEAKPNDNNRPDTQSETRKPETSTPSTFTTPAAQSPAPPPPAVRPPPPPPRPPPPPSPQVTTAPISTFSGFSNGPSPTPDTIVSSSSLQVSLSPSVASTSSLSSLSSQPSGQPQPGSSQVLGPAQFSPEAIPGTTAAPSLASPPPPSLAAQVLPPLSTDSISLPASSSSSTSSSPTHNSYSNNASSSSTGSSGMPVGMIAGITVGGVSAVAIIGALIYLFLRLRRGPKSRARKQEVGPKDTLQERRMRSRTASPEPEMMDGLVNSAAPVAGFDDKSHGAAEAKPNAVSAPPRSNRAPGDAARKSLLDIFKRRTQTANRDLAPSGGGPVAEKRLSIVTDAPPMRADAADDGSGWLSPDQQGSKSGRPHLAQQAEPASSVNCPYARLQNKLLRAHNSTDPRPCHRDMNNRDSISSTITCTTCNSSPTSPRFAFSGFMKPPSLGFLKFENSVNSRPWRGSGWSVWFRQEDSKDRNSRAPDTQEK